MGKLQGNLLVGQSGGPTPVINASLAGVIKGAKAQGVSNIYGLEHGIEGALKRRLYNLSEEPSQLVEQLLYTPASILGSCRHKLAKEEEYQQILQLFKERDIRYFAYIGGNDSMDTCHKIAQLAQKEKYDMQVIGIPKTIDNDLPFTDHCPGFGSAARFIALSTIESGRDLEAMKTFDDIAIYEVMGRHAGWLAAASALGKKDVEDAPHLIYLPERPFDEEKFLAEVQAVHRELGYAYVIISEGIRDKAGEFIGAHNATLDAFGHKAISLSDGPGAYLSKRITSQLGLKARCNRPGTIQRSFAANLSIVDRDEAFRVGEKAIDLFVQGITDVMVTLDREPGPVYYCQTGQVPLEKVANVEKLMPENFINEEDNFVTKEYFTYCMPLIGESLPRYGRLSRKLVD